MENSFTIIRRRRLCLRFESHHVNRDRVFHFNIIRYLRRILHWVVSEYPICAVFNATFNMSYKQIFNFISLLLIAEILIVCNTLLVFCFYDKACFRAIAAAYWVCGIVLYVILRRNEYLQSFYPSNIALIWISLVYLILGAAFLFFDCASLKMLIPIGVTLLISLCVVFPSFRIRDLSRRVIVIFTSIAAILTLIGVFFIFFSPGNPPLQITGGIFLSVAAVVVIFTISCGLQRRLKQAVNWFFLLLELLKLCIPIIALYLALCVAFIIKEVKSEPTPEYGC
nr:unnamed protein product [Trichobilharzia regenti]